MGQSLPGSVYVEAKLEVRHVTANLLAPQAVYLIGVEEGHFRAIQGQRV